MANVGVKVGGAWAALGLQQEQQKAVINELCSQVRKAGQQSQLNTVPYFHEHKHPCHSLQLSSLHSRHEQLSSEYDQLELKHGGLIKTHSQTVADLQIRNRQLEDISGNLDTSNFLTKVFSTMLFRALLLQADNITKAALSPYDSKYPTVGAQACKHDLVSKNAGT